MATLIRTLALILPLASIGCSSMKSPTYAADTLQKIRLLGRSTPVVMATTSYDTLSRVVVNGTKYVMIHGEDPETLYAIIADEENVVMIPRDRIASMEAVAARRHMIAIDMGYDPTLTACLQIARRWAIGSMVRYRSPFGLFGRYMFNTGPTDSIEAVELGAEIRFYLSGGALRGFYVGPTLAYGLITRTLRPLQLKGWQRVGVSLGWQWFPIYSVGVGISAGFNGYVITDPGIPRTSIGAMMDTIDCRSDMRGRGPWQKGSFLIGTGRGLHTEALAIARRRRTSGRSIWRSKSLLPRFPMLPPRP